MKILIKTLSGLEDPLAQEVIDLGGKDIRKIRRAVECEGSIEFLYKCNLHLRTALRVLLPVYSFTAKDEQQLYKNVYDFDWSHFLDHHQTFAIDNAVFSNYFKHSKYAALKAKDAIVDQFRDKYNKRPSVDRDNPDVLINLHAHQENFTISLDSSGETLNKRGNRKKGHKAPINEVLAAGMLKLAGWNKSTPLFDPFCGTGTILMEAALMALNIAPLINRHEFGFKNWKNFESSVWHRIKADAQANVRKTPLDIYGSDIDPGAISLAKSALAEMRIGRGVTVREMDFKKQNPKTPDGMIITNPPYGERIGEDEVMSLYKAMGDHFKQNFKGFDAWIISSNTEALKKVGLKRDESFKLFNGALECAFNHYPLY